MKSFFVEKNYPNHKNQNNNIAKITGGKHRYGETNCRIEIIFLVQKIKYSKGVDIHIDCTDIHAYSFYVISGGCRILITQTVKRVWINTTDFENYSKIMPRAYK